MRNITDYTEQEIDALEEGRETDAIVSIEVMGIPPDKWNPPCAKHHSTDDASFNYGTWSGWCYDCNKIISEVEGEPERYSTDIGAAWLIGERMKEIGLNALYATNIATHVHGFYKTHDWGSDFWFYIAHASPLQRCKAALKAIRAMRIMENANA